MYLIIYSLLSTAAAIAMAYLKEPELAILFLILSKTISLEIAIRKPNV